MHGLDRARSAFERAAASSAERVVRDLRLAGRTVHLDVVGRPLFDRLFPPFAHVDRVAPAGSADLHVRVWDVAATGVLNPDAGQGDPGMNGVIDVSADRQRLRYRRRTSTSWLDREAQDLVACFSSAAGTSLNDRGKPLQFPLAVWHLDRGCPMIHAGVVALNGRGVLFPGKSGTGKTTAALSCAMAGYDYVSDDCVGIEQRAAGPIRAHSVFASANIAPHHLARFPSLAPHALTEAHEDEEKYLLLLNTLLPRPLAGIAEVEAIVIPTVLSGSGGTTRLVPTTRADALRSLAPSTLLFFPGWGAGQLDFLASLVEKVPCYRLDMGPHLEEIPECLRAVVAA